MEDTAAFVCPQFMVSPEKKRREGEPPLRDNKGQVQRNKSMPIKSGGDYRTFTVEAEVRTIPPTQEPAVSIIRVVTRAVTSTGSGWKKRMTRQGRRATMGNMHYMNYLYRTLYPFVRNTLTDRCINC